MGYTELASVMGKNPELAVFRRFSALNAKNLLYLQAELVNLEARLQRHTASTPDPEKARYESDWFSLSRSEKDGDDKQWQTFLEIREKLKEYNKALCQQAIVSGFGQPNKHDMEFLRNWLARSKAEGILFIGQDNKVWDTDDDLLALYQRKSPDFFSDWLTNGLLPWFYHKIGYRFKDKGKTILPSSSVGNVPARGLQEEYVKFSDDKLVKAADIIITVVSSVLPVTSVIVLYYVHNMIARLGIVAAFTGIFSLTLAIVTDARRVEIFASTAGFAAVLVVFVGSTSFGLDG